MKRIGEMILIRPEGLARYRELHANPLPGVNEMLKACHIRNYTIYQRGEFMFASYEYTGEDFEADMARLSADPATREWDAPVNPLMRPLPDRAPGEFWAKMEEIYHLD